MALGVVLELSFLLITLKCTYLTQLHNVSNTELS